jgi:hypothetical protein
MLCPFQRTPSVFVGMLCAFFSMLRAFVAVHRELVGHPPPRRATLSTERFVDVASVMDLVKDRR